MEEASEKKKRLTPAQWEEAVAHWEIGDTSLEDLSKKFDVSTSALSQGFKGRGVTKGSRSKEIAKKIADKATSAIAASIVTFAEQRQERIEETKKQHYEWEVALGKLTMARVIDAQRSGRAFESEVHNLRALRIASIILQQVRQERYELLDAKDAIDENELPELKVLGLTQDQVKRIREKQDENDDLLEEVDVSLPDLDDIVEEGGDV